MLGSPDCLAGGALPKVYDVTIFYDTTSSNGCAQILEFVRGAVLIERCWFKIKIIDNVKINEIILLKKFIWLYVASFKNAGVLKGFCYSVWWVFYATVKES